MKHILLSTFLIGTLSTWGVAQKPQTTAELLRPTTSAEVNRPSTTVQTARPFTSAELNRPTTQTGAVRAQTTASANRPQTDNGLARPATNVEVIPPATTVEVVHPQTTVEVLHPQTPGFVAGTSAESITGHSAQKGGKGVALSSAQATSMSDFKPKQAKDFTAAQKAAPIGGGENKLGNETNMAEKDAANKASLLGKQNNQNMDIDPNIKTTNLSGLGKSIEKQLNEKKKK